MNWTYFWQGFKDVFTGRSAADAWCSLAHDGGRIKRDEQGRINWQCDKCGRWSRHPVPLDEEERATRRAIVRAAAEIGRGMGGSNG